MIDDVVENGLSPWGCSAKLFQHHWRHASVQSLYVETISPDRMPGIWSFLLG